MAVYLAAIGAHYLAIEGLSQVKRQTALTYGSRPNYSDQMEHFLNLFISRILGMANEFFFTKG
jgi:hypothetical protein